MASPFENFALTDPVAAQQVVQLAQILQAEKAAQAQSRANTLQAITQGNVARDANAQQRAYTQAQLAQRDREMAQQQAQFATTDAYRNKALEVNKTLTEADINSRRTDANKVADERGQLELFNALQAEVTGQNPPTDLEFEARTMDLHPRRKEILNRLRASTISELNRMADVADNAAMKWQNKLSSLKPDQTFEREKILADFEKSKDRNFVELDSTTGTFRSMMRRPRSDSSSAPGSSVTPIGEILRRLNTPSNPIVTPLPPTGFVPDPSTAFPVGQSAPPTQSTLGSIGQLLSPEINAIRSFVNKARGVSPTDGNNFGNRNDGTKKGMGYFGALTRPDGAVSTELSIGVNFDGQEREIPALVPTLTPEEVNYLLSGGKPTAAIIDKAVSHARSRIQQGLDPFAQSGEQGTAPTSAPVRRAAPPVGVNSLYGPVSGPPPIPPGPVYGPEPKPPDLRLVYPEYLINPIQPRY